MSMEIIDITLAVAPGMVTWYNAEVGFNLDWVARIGEDESPANVSVVTLGTHTGTHLDAPLHFVDGGATVEHLDLSHLIGPCYVAEFPDLALPLITPSDFETAGIPSGVTRLLCKTSNARRRLLLDAKFHEDFVAISPDGARWLIEHGINLVGVDYLSVGSASDGTGTRTHQILLAASVVAVEGLVLWDVAPGHYFLVCLPPKYQGAEGAAVRAVLLTQMP